MIEAIDKSVRLSLCYENDSFSYKNILPEANHEDLYQLAVIFNSLQNEPIEKVKIVKEYSLFNFG